MKNFIAVNFLLWIGFQIQAQNFSIKGSDTMYPLVQGLIELYTNESDQKVSVAGGGSGTGIKALQKGDVSVAMTSRAMKDSEKGVIVGLKSKEIAYDALSVIIHPSNSVSKLTKKQIADIFSGKIRNWQELGGSDLPITVYTRDPKSGTYDFMKTFVMGGTDYVSYAKQAVSNSGIVQSVSNEAGAIGYVGMAYVEEIVQTVAISVDGQNYVAPTFRSALEKKYPLTRPLYFYYLSMNESKVTQFIDFTMSSIGQKLASYKGYIPAAF